MYKQIAIHIELYNDDDQNNNNKKTRKGFAKNSS